MEVAQDNAQEIVIIGTHAVDHAVKNGMNLHVLFLSDIQFINRTDGLVENRIEKTVLFFHGKTPIKNIVYGSAAETVQGLAVFC